MSGSNVADRCALVYEACGSNLTAATDALRACFELSPCRIERPANGTPDRRAAERDLDGPGLAVIFACGLDRVLALVPASLPLPDWYREASMEQADRMEKLAVEWSLSLLPVEMEPWEVEARPVSNLREFAASARSPDDSASFDLRVDFEPEGDTGPEEKRPSRFVRITSTHDEPRSRAAGDGRTGSGLGRLVPLSVPISVRLAEKTIDVGRFVGLTPGALITFDKSCEAPLELYVNNRLYARGEAVKIGEKFGLKIDEIGVTRPRVSTVYEG